MLYYYWCSSIPQFCCFLCHFHPVTAQPGAKLAMDQTTNRCPGPPAGSPRQSARNFDSFQNLGEVDFLLSFCDIYCLLSLRVLFIASRCVVKKSDLFDDLQINIKQRSGRRRISGYGYMPNRYLTRSFIKLNFITFTYIFHLTETY